MNRSLKPTYVEAILSALALLSDEVALDDLNLAVSANLKDLFTEERSRAKELLERVNNFCTAPQDGLLLSAEENAFVVNALRNLISVDQKAILEIPKAKQRTSLQQEIRSASACVSFLQKSSASLEE